MKEGGANEDLLAVIIVSEPISFNKMGDRDP
jgi:hypothetical protein